MNHNKTLITETIIENCYIENDEFFYIIPWWTTKEYEHISVSNIPDWVVNKLNTNIRDFKVDIKLIDNNVPTIIQFWR